MQTVKDLMIPIEKYVTVPDDTTVGEAIRVLQKIRDLYEAEGREYKPRHLIVLDKKNRVVGRLSQMDVVISLEPKYRTEHGDEAITHTSASGLSPELIKDMIRWYSLWGETFEERCQKVVKMSVRDCMKSPRKDEYIKDHESLEAAVHQMVMGRQTSLLVVHDQQVIGILRLSDVFDRIAHTAVDENA